MTETELLLPVMQAHPLATVIAVSPTEPQPFISHLPLLATFEDGKIKLAGHLSKRNQQWRYFQAGASVTVIFHGPNAYINPSWYAENDVPTWSYLVVHARGTVRLVEESSHLKKMVRDLSDTMNRKHNETWDFWLPEDLRTREQINSAIVGFEMEPEELFGKFKMMQTRSIEDQNRVIAGLRGRSDALSHLLADAMAGDTSEIKSRR